MSLPLCVDLDGTVVRTDLLFESTAVLLRTKPWLMFALPVWLGRGKAQLKRQIASRVQINAALLPYNREFVDWVAHEHERGRGTVLITASDELLARSVASHLAIFDLVIGSDGVVNQKGETKLRTLAARYEGKFAYAGNSSADIVIWNACDVAIVVNASSATEKTARRIGNVARVFAPQRFSYSHIRRALSPRIWQVILTASIAPTMVTHNPLWAIAALAVCCLLTGTFLMRDVIFVERDRATPRRSGQPLASGDFPLSAAFIIGPALLLAGFAGTIYIAARNAG